MSNEEVTRLVLEIDTSTKEWFMDMRRRYNCTTHKELVFLALRFMDETPYDKLPFEIRGIVTRKAGEEIPQDAYLLRWQSIERIQKEIDTFLVRTNKDKGTLTRMIGELRHLLKDHSTDHAAKMVRELKEIKEEMEKRDQN